MPIIPRLETPQGIPTLAQSAPGIEAFPGYNQSKLGAQVAEGGMGIASVGVAIAAEKKRQDRIQGLFKAETLKSEAATRLEDAMESARTKPQEVIEGVEPTGDDGGMGGVADPVVTTTYVPRSQTLVSDYTKSQEQILKEIEAKAGNNPYIMQHLRPSLEHLKTTATIRMQRESLTLQKQETAATINENVDIMMKELRVKDPVPAKPDENGITTINLDDDRSYNIARAGVAQAIDTASREGGLDPKAAEQMKQNRLARMDHGRAVKTATADPEAWLAASGSGTNGWQARLTDEAMAKLDAKAEAAIKRKEGSANQARLERERMTEADFFARTQPGAKQALALDDVTQAVSVDRSITAAKGEHWNTVVKNLAVGGWDDDPKTRIDMALEAGSFKVQPEFMDRVDARVRSKQLSLKTGEDLKNTARGIIQKRNDVATQEAYHDFSATQTAMNTMLTTSPLLGAKLDQESQTVRANAQAALLENAKRNGWETSFEWWKKNGDKYTGQLQDRVSSQIETYNGQLPTPIQKDPKTRQITPESIQAATGSAFERYKIDPLKAAELQRTGKLPAGLLNELKTLDELEKWTNFQSDYRTKRDAARGGK